MENREMWGDVEGWSHTLLLHMGLWLLLAHDRGVPVGDFRFWFKREITLCGHGNLITCSKDYIAN